MIIRASTCLRNSYNEISKFCKETNEPIYLTKNGEGDLVVLSIEAYEREKRMADLRMKLLMTEIDLLKGEKTYSREEIESILDKDLENAKWLYNPLQQKFFRRT